jgi:hypothetical protein
VDQAKRRLGDVHGRRRDRRDRRTDIAQHGILRRHQQHGANARLARGGIGVDCLHTRVRQRRAQDARVQHPRQLDVDSEPYGAGDLGASVLAWHRLADHPQRIVHR